MNEHKLRASVCVVRMRCPIVEHKTTKLPNCVKWTLRLVCISDYNSSCWKSVWICDACVQYPPCENIQKKLKNGPCQPKQCGKKMCVCKCKITNTKIKMCNVQCVCVCVCVCGNMCVFAVYMCTTISWYNPFSSEDFLTELYRFLLLHFLIVQKRKNPSSNSL